ncbi:hypothetical protein HK098_004211 [Nowakowskiella sp. JEL0407]|nr:hypothetical protein HK098_004211 [Nowakowskiella sp. JEL0407]
MKHLHFIITTFFFLTLLSGVSPQQLDPRCFVIQGSSVAPEFNSAAIVTSTNNYNDTKSLDAYLNARFDDKPSYVSSFKAAYTCPNWDGRKQRYHMSAFTGLILSQSQSICSAVKFAPLCKTSCNTAVSALQAIFSNTAYCSATPDANGLKNRNQTIQVMTSFCASLSNTADCKEGITRETGQCGFPLSIDLQDYCADAQSTASDDCCQRARSAGSLVPTLPTVPNLVGSTPDANAVDNGIGQSVSQDTSLFIGLAAMGGIILLAVLALIPLMLRRRKAKRQEAESNRNINLSNMDDERAIVDGYGMGGFAVKNGNGSGSTVTAVQNRSVPNLPNIPTEELKRSESVVSAPNTIISAPTDRNTQEYYRNSNAMIAESMFSAMGGGSNSFSGNLNNSSESAQPSYMETEGSTSSELPSSSTLDRTIKAINEGKTMKVVYEYSSRLPDELRLNFGDIVVVDAVYDDGWGSGTNLVTGLSGAFPLIAVGPIEDDPILSKPDASKRRSIEQVDSRISNLSRNSSLNRKNEGEK